MGGVRAISTPPAGRRLEDLPNVGPAMAADLHLLGLRDVGDLVGQDGCDLYTALCLKTGSYQDPCVLDTLLAVVDHVGGAPALPWWHYTAERKRSVRCLAVLEQARLRWRTTPPSHGAHGAAPQPTGPARTAG